MVKTARYGSFDYRLGRSPVTAKGRVRFPHEPPNALLSEERGLEQVISFKETPTCVLFGHRDLNESKS